MVLNDRSLLFESEETSFVPTRTYHHMTLIRLLFSICLIISNLGITLFVILLYYIGRAIRRSLPWHYEHQFLNDYLIIDDDFGSIFDDNESSDREDLSDGLYYTDREESILPVRDDPSDKSEDDDEIQSVYEGDESSQGEASDTMHNRLLFINPPLRNNQPLRIRLAWIDRDKKLDNDGDLLDEDGLNSIEDDDYSFKGEDFDRMCEEILRNPLDDEDYSLEDQDLDGMCDRIMRGLFYINPHLRVRVAWIDPTDDFLNDSDNSLNKDELNNADDQDYSLKGDDCDRMRDENLRQELDNDDSFQDLDRFTEKIIRGLLYINPPFRERLEWIDSTEELYDDDILLNKDDSDEIMRGFDYLLKMVARRKRLSFFCRDRGVLECDDISEEFDDDDDLLDNIGSDSKEDDDYSFNGEDYDRICDIISCEPLGDDDCSLESEDLDKLCDDTMCGFYEEHDWIYEDEFENRDDDDAFEDFDGMCGEMRGDALEDLLESVTFELVVICSICIAFIIRFFY
ncbi:hypothetical protein AVEN_128420-1 [Araneus ventricosus]|uniref:Uncharacterized protein n=1 Tax=Araneus ventricosus TaxID=182803 RepID=A0A4Y2GI45_ARAVE|nr:hypothetical protein AVEN_128420-1 [Araneus ventricosus]